MEENAFYISDLGTSFLLSIGILLASTVIFSVIATFFGCLFAGIDRKISARMQGRIGPPILQPYYDVRKLFEKEKASVNGSEKIYVTLAFFAVLIAGGVFVSGFVYFALGYLVPELESFQYNGGNWLLCVFMLTLASLFLIMAAYCTRSPYSEIGGAREILQLVSYEPTTMLIPVGLFICTGSFCVQSVFSLPFPLLFVMWPMLICLVFVLLIKFRKSPFDISMSHHAHQEIVRGITTEMSGPTLAKVEIMHWCENFLFVMWIALFFLSAYPAWGIIATFASIIIYFIIIWIDNNCARVK